MTGKLLNRRRKSHPSKWTNGRLAEACRFAKDLASSDILKAALEEAAKRLERQDVKTEDLEPTLQETEETP